jgi:hypothetical protein
MQVDAHVVDGKMQAAIEFTRLMIRGYSYRLKNLLYATEPQKSGCKT